MIACPMGGDSLSWIATCSKRGSILACLLCWIASHWLGCRDVGPWSFVPDHSVVTRQDYADFEKLALEAERILDSDEYSGEGIEEFQDRGGSPGGARPKIFARYEGKEWLVKFRAKRDPQSIGVDEYRYSLLAKKCGIEMPKLDFSKASTSAWSVRPNASRQVACC